MQLVFASSNLLLLSLDLNMFGLALPAQRSALNHFSDFVHDNNHDHENDDAHENIGSLEYARRHTDEKTHTLGSGDEFSDDGADDREGNARADASKNVGRNRWEDHFEC